MSATSRWAWCPTSSGARHRRRRQTPAQQDNSRHLAWVRLRRRGERCEVSLPVPGGRDLLVEAAAAVSFIKDKLDGSLKGKKIAYLYYDNPAGAEPMPILKELQGGEGFELRQFAVHRQAWK